MKNKKHKLLKVLGISALATLILVLDKKVNATESNKNKSNHIV